MSHLILECQLRLEAVKVGDGPKSCIHVQEEFWFSVGWKVLFRFCHLPCPGIATWCGHLLELATTNLKSMYPDLIFAGSGFRRLDKQSAKTLPLLCFAPLLSPCVASANDEQPYARLY